MNQRNLAGWGRYQPDRYTVLSPAQVSKEHGSLARGLGRSYGDASLPVKGQSSVNALALDKFAAFDTETGLLEAESGISLQSLLKVFIPRGFFPAVTPGTQYVTLGGMAASNVHGKNHHVVGSIEHAVTGLQVETAVGLFDCSREALPDLFHATLGGYGLTGLIRKVSMRLKPIESSSIKTRTLRATCLRDLFDLFRAHDQGWDYSVAWLDALARGGAMGRGILMLGRHATRDEARGRLVASAKPKIRIPFDFPSFLLNPLFMRMFNSAYYLAGRRGSEYRVENYEPFFYPLDAILEWNKVYGKSGFFQHQFVIPDPRGEEGMEHCLHFLSSKGLGSFLSVLKRCADDTVALPFCKTGYTLALDIPNRSTPTLQALDELDAIVLKYGGRVYLTKDARMRPDTFRAMYPEASEWVKALRKYNPEKRFNSRMAERLKIWDM